MASKHQRMRLDEQVVGDHGVVGLPREPTATPYIRLFWPWFWNAAL
jgi:hypothetical protein